MLSWLLRRRGGGVLLGLLMALALLAAMAAGPPRRPEPYAAAAAVPAGPKPCRGVERCAVPPRPGTPRGQERQAAGAAGCGVVTARKRPAKHPARHCSWHDCPHPAAATVVFELSNLLAGSRRDYCAAHTTKVCTARGTVVVARFGPHQPALPGLPDATAARRAGRAR